MNLNTYDDRLELVNGNYQSLVKARSPKGIDGKNAYIIGTGLAGLATGCFLIKDAHMAGDRITFFGELDHLNADSEAVSSKLHYSYAHLDGGEIGQNFNVLWDLYSAIPSLGNKEESILDNLYYINRDDPNFSNCRITHRNGQRYDNGNFNLTSRVMKDIAKLTITGDEKLENLQINQVFSSETLNSDFWMMWRSMFGFQNWSSALEMKLGFNRLIHHMGDLANMSAIRFTKYDYYESIIKPIIQYLKDHGVKFLSDRRIEDIEFELTSLEKNATALVTNRIDKDEPAGGEDASSHVAEFIKLSRDDLVFITNGSIAESYAYGGDEEAANLIANHSASWELWKSIARKSDDFGHPERFSSNIERTNGCYCTITVKGGRTFDYITRIARRRPDTGKTVTGGIVTAKDSNWLLSWSINRQPQSIEQLQDEVLVSVQGQLTNVEGNYIRKPMRDCTGKDITKEWMFHLGVPPENIEELASECIGIPVMMPYITSHLEPRKFGDRPFVVPKNAVNFAFIGEFSETLDKPGRDTVIANEYPVRTAMEAVYVLCGVEKGIPEVYGSRYDIRCLLSAASALNDHKKPDINLPWVVRKKLEKNIKGTDIEKILQENNLI